MDIPQLDEIINNTNYQDTLLYLQITNLLIISKNNSESSKIIIKSFLNSHFFNILRDNLKMKKNNDKILFEILKGEKKIQFFNFLLETLEFLFNISNFFLSLQSKFPTYEIEELINKLKSLYDIEDSEYIEIIKIYSSYENYKNNLSSFAKIEEKFDLKKSLKRGFFEEKKDIPIDYHLTPIEISSEEIFQEYNKEIEMHREKGSYESWKRYLNTLFYLTREDCYRSLKKEIKFILTYDIENIKDKKTKITDMYYYKNIKLDSLVAGKDGVLVNIIIDMKINNIKMLSNKRLLHGSLVIFTDNSFENTIFCVVKEVKKDDLKKKRIRDKIRVSLEFLHPKFEEIKKILSLNSEKISNV